MTQPDDATEHDDGLSEAEIEQIEEIAGTHVRPRWAPLTVVGFVALLVTARLADVYYARLVKNDPEVLLLFNARVRYLLLATGSDISFWSYAAIGAVRMTVVYAVCHMVGRAFGRDVLVWFGKYLGARPKQIQDTLQMFHRAEWAVIPFFAGSNIVAAITGVVRTPLKRLVPLLAIGIVGRLILWWWVAQVADDQVDATIRFLDRYQWPMTIASLVVTALVIGINLRRGRDFTLDS